QHRHRLNRGGNREANRSLWVIAIVRMASDPSTQSYVQRRTQQGLSKKEILRCLKRYIARQLYRLLLGPRQASSRASSTPALTANRSVNALPAVPPRPAG